MWDTGEVAVCNRACNRNMDSGDTLSLNHEARDAVYKLKSCPEQKNQMHQTREGYREERDVRLC